MKKTWLEFMGVWICYQINTYDMKKTSDLMSWEYESVIKWILRNEKKHVTWGHGSMNLLSNKYLEMKKKHDLRSWEYESVIK